MTNNIPNIPNHVPTPFEVQERSIRTLNRVLLIHINKNFETRQEKITALNFMIEKIRSFISLVVSNRPIPVPKKYHNEFNVQDYLAKGIATHLMLYCQIGSLDPLVVIDVIIGELNRNINLIKN